MVAKSVWLDWMDVELHPEFAELRAKVPQSQCLWYDEATERVVRSGLALNCPLLARRALKCAKEKARLERLLSGRKDARMALWQQQYERLFTHDYPEFRPMSDEEIAELVVDPRWKGGNPPRDVPKTEQQMELIRICNETPPLWDLFYERIFGDDAK